MTNPAVVLDIGSAILKGGLSSETMPTALCPTTIVKSGKTNNIITNTENYTKKNGALSYAVENGVIVDWEGMEKIWDNVFQKLFRISTKDHPILLTESPFNTLSNRSKMAEIMFEKYSTPSILIKTSGELSTLGTGHKTGILLEIGHELTQVIPFYDGHILNNSISFNFGGSDLTDYLMRKLSKNNMSFTTRLDKEMIQRVKEVHCFVSNKESENTTDNITTYTLPDGRDVQLGNEKFQCAELLFDPTLNNLDFKGIHEILNDSINLCALDVRKSLYSNIILAGSTTLFKGLNERLTNEIKLLAPYASDLSVIDRGHQYSAWIGGAVLANHSSFHSTCVKKEDYKEYGTSVICEDIK